MSFNLNRDGNSDNDCIYVESFEQTSDHYCSAKRPRDNTQDVRRVKKRLNLEGSSENYSSKKIRKFKKKSVIKYARRCESSLSELTKRFVNVLLAQEDNSVNLNSISDELDVPKRRLYDITNVLEGAGLLDKPSRNLVQWKQDSGVITAHLQNDVNNLKIKEKLLDDIIKYTETIIISSKEENETYAYISHEDLKAITNFENKTILGIEASPKTKLCVHKNYRLHFQSKIEPIFAFLIDENKFKPLDNNLFSDDTIKISNNQLCLPDTMQFKQTLTLDDEFSVGNFLFQTDDQLVDYNFVLDDEEGLTELFEPSDLLGFETV